MARKGCLGHPIFTLTQIPLAPRTGCAHPSPTGPDATLQSMKAVLRRRLRRVAGIACGGTALLTLGCASPGPPRPPSLKLPQPVRDLTALREGDAVTLHLTLPLHTTDGLPLRPPTVFLTLCRGLEREPCEPVQGTQNQQMDVVEGNGAARSITLRDTLPASLSSGPPQPLLYRVQLSNPAGRNAGWSQPAYTLAGSAPPPVEGFHAEGTRAGILLRWTPEPTNPQQATEVIVRRERIGPPPPGAKKSAKQPVWLATHAQPTGTAAAKSLDASAQQDVPYRYIAVRRESVDADGQHLDLRSVPSASVEITLRDIFPPPIPTDLSAAPFNESGHFAIDLVWQPVSDTRLAGYNVTRQALDANGAPVGTAQRLNAGLITLPAFHDATATPQQGYRYGVSAVDQKGNESAAVTVDVQPQ